MPQVENHPASQNAIAPALEVILRDQNGTGRRLADFRGHSVVLFFYPKDDTPGCTVEGKEFRQLFEQFHSYDAAIIGVSTDSVESHRRYAEKHAFQFVLLSDENGEVANAFGVLRDKHAARSTFVLDPELRIRRAFHEVTPRGHAQQVLNFVRSLVEAKRMIGG
jgi:thioredoxin-dependent peroxiredoxin